MRALQVHATWLYGVTWVCPNQEPLLSSAGPESESTRERERPLTWPHGSARVPYSVAGFVCRLSYSFVFFLCVFPLVFSSPPQAAGNEISAAWTSESESDGLLGDMRHVPAWHCSVSTDCRIADLLDWITKGGKTTFCWVQGLLPPPQIKIAWKLSPFFRQRKI